MPARSHISLGPARQQDRTAIVTVGLQSRGLTVLSSNSATVPSSTPVDLPVGGPTAWWLRKDLHRDRHRRGSTARQALRRQGGCRLDAAISTMGKTRAASLQVPPVAVSRARGALAAVPGLRLEPPDGRDGVIVVRTAAAPAGSAGGSPDPVSVGLRAVLDAGVPLLSFDAGGGRLDEAFLALTGRADT